MRAYKGTNEYGNEEVIIILNSRDMEKYCKNENYAMKWVYRHKIVRECIKSEFAKRTAEIKKSDNTSNIKRYLQFVRIIPEHVVLTKTDDELVVINHAALHEMLDRLEKNKADGMGDEDNAQDAASIFDFITSTDIYTNIITLV